ncbi:MAG: GAF domain-containing protein [Acidobacteria bacterium]|nr:MAG: GAF domain-containing protein [Acidobacteriota bacterium]
MEKVASSDAIVELRATLERARELFDQLVEGRAAEAAEALAERPSLDAKLEEVERDREELSARLVEAEHQLGRLMNLYVATFQLHATLDPDEVQATIAEIAVDLLGAERFVLLLRLEGSSECEIALAKGLEQDPSGLYAGDRYRGGDPLVDAALEDGVLRLGPDEFSEAIAAVPLRVQEAIVGVLVVLKLFDHKAILRAEDRDLLDLLAAHAASALFAARVYSNTDRKLRTLESLVQLVRGT